MYVMWWFLGVCHPIVVVSMNRWCSLSRREEYQMSHVDVMLDLDQKVKRSSSLYRSLNNTENRIVELSVKPESFGNTERELWRFRSDTRQDKRFSSFVLLCQTECNIFTRRSLCSIAELGICELYSSAEGVNNMPGGMIWKPCLNSERGNTKLI